MLLVVAKHLKYNGLCLDVVNESFSHCDGDLSGRGGGGVYECVAL